MARMRPRERSSPGCSGAGPLRRARRGGVHPLLRLEDEASPAIDVDPAVSLARPRGPAHRRAAGGRGPAVADGLRVRHAPARRDRRRSARKALPVPVAAGLRPRRRQGAARRPGPRRLQGALAQRRRPRRHDRGQVPRPPPEEEISPGKDGVCCHTNGLCGDLRDGPNGEEIGLPCPSCADAARLPYQTGRPNSGFEPLKRITGSPADSRPRSPSPPSARRRRVRGQ
jgi:hypothetical protein